GYATAPVTLLTLGNRTTTVSRAGNNTNAAPREDREVTMRTHCDDWISSTRRRRQPIPWENCFRERKMRKLRMAFCSAAVLLSAIPTVLAQNPANEHNCPAQTGAGGGLEAEPPYVGSGHDGFSRNQSLCLPQL